MEVTRIALTGGVGMLTGEGEPVDTMGAEEPDMDMEEPAMEPTDDMDDGDAMADMDDGMGASAPAAGGDEPAGRPQRESIQRSRKLGQVLSKKKK